MLDGFRHTFPLIYSNAHISHSSALDISFLALGFEIVVHLKCWDRFGITLFWRIHKRIYHSRMAHFRELMVPFANKWIFVCFCAEGGIVLRFEIERFPCLICAAWVVIVLNSHSPLLIVGMPKFFASFASAPPSWPLNSISSEWSEIFLSFCILIGLLWSGVRQVVSGRIKNSCDPINCLWNLPVEFFSFFTIIYGHSFFTHHS